MTNPILPVIEHNGDPAIIYPKEVAILEPSFPREFRRRLFELPSARFMILRRLTGEWLMFMEH